MWAEVNFRCQDSIRTLSVIVRIYAKMIPLKSKFTVLIRNMTEFVEE